MTETKPLLAFAAVIEHGTMHAAARALGMTPSAVSQHISRLEALHGVKLLKRSTRRIVPTEAGAALAAHCVKLRQALLNAQAALDNIKTEAAGEVRLALPSPLTLAPDFQTALLRVAAEFPKISMRLFVSDELADLQRHNIDIALRGGDTALDAPDLVAGIWRTGSGRYTPHPVISPKQGSLKALRICAAGVGFRAAMKPLRAMCCGAVWNGSSWKQTMCGRAAI